ncbi:ATP-binding protein [Streptomyces sp. NPDC012888]|uniref:ATP-binding protein n=1 Tax=Streptomyces sp. NPDC012888 TaxID=3364855 RepID=UPI0036B6E88A
MDAIGRIGHAWLIPRGQGAAVHARDLTTATLTAWGWPADRVEIAVLLVSELVTNAHRHAGTDAWLHLDPIPDGARLAVRDNDPAPPVPRTPDLDRATGGFGLHLLDRLSAEWGVDGDSTGKRVWAHVLTCGPAG